MNNGKLIAGVAVGVAIALFLIPKTRKIITDAVSGLTDSLKDIAGNAAEAAESARELGAA